MSIKRGNPDQYLQRVGGTYYARVRVPRTLEKYTGQTHIRRSLGTGDRADANRRKHAVVGTIKAELERLYGADKAKRWFKAATTTTDTLPELMDEWLRVSDYKASTNAGHRKALAEVLGFIGNDHAVPSDITRKVAISFIDNDLTQRDPGLAHSTIRDRLVSLGGFWKWMSSRAAVASGVNPWSDHKISKQSNKGRSPPKRKGGYTDAEIIKLLVGNERVKACSQGGGRLRIDGRQHEEGRCPPGRKGHRSHC